MTVHIKKIFSSKHIKQFSNLLSDFIYIFLAWFIAMALNDFWMHDCVFISGGILDKVSAAIVG